MWIHAETALFGDPRAKKFFPWECGWGKSSFEDSARMGTRIITPALWQFVLKQFIVTFYICINTYLLYYIYLSFHEICVEISFKSNVYYNILILYLLYD